MDLVTCPSCQFTFSPTSGQAVKCPACMASIGPKNKSAARPAAPKPPAPAASRKLPPPLPAARPAPRPRSNRREPEPSRGNGLLVAVFGALFVLIGVGVGFLVMRSLTNGEANDAPVAKLPEPIPEIIAPKIVPPKTVPPANVPPMPDPEPADPQDPTPKFELPPPKLPATKELPKVRPLDRPDPPDIAKEPPPKPKKTVVVREVNGVTPQLVDAAIKRGVQYEIASQGEWLHHSLGHAALGGLTLVECKVSVKHPLILQAADITRKLGPSATKTYELSVAIMFLDRLGDPRDRGLIQGMAARLVAGQLANGSYSYYCPALSQEETVTLLHFLRTTRPPLAIGAPDPVAMEKKGTGDVLDPFGGGGEPGNPLEPRPTIIDDDGGTLVSMPPKVLPKNRINAEAGTIRLKPGPAGGAVVNPGILTETLKKSPVVVNQGREKKDFLLVEDGVGNSDHSNMQFAVVALWAARRHGAVTDRALQLAEAHLRKVQKGDGGWLYDNHNGTPAMVCAGLIGLTLGQASNQANAEGLSVALTRDPNLGSGLARLGTLVHEPHNNIEDANGGDAAPAYFLWSLERVAVMLNLQTISGKDWYGWGAQQLLKRQDPRGSWSHGNFEGSASRHVETCLSLLFLIRSNLVQEVTEQIQLQMPISEGRP